MQSMDISIKLSVHRTRVLYHYKQIEYNILNLGWSPERTAVWRSNDQSKLSRPLSPDCAGVFHFFVPLDPPSEK